jgi:hypothetical protein
MTSFNLDLNAFIVSFPASTLASEMTFDNTCHLGNNIFFSFSESVHVVILKLKFIPLYHTLIIQFY